jgi:tetratricopeptide (TPR) repeat protein
MGRKRKEKQLRKAEGTGKPKAVPVPAGDKPISSWVVIGVFAVLFILIAVTAYSKKSNTVDEPIHLLAGYSYLKWGDFRMNPEHPPLAKMWAALPLLAFGTRVVPSDITAPEPRYFSGSIAARDLQSYFPGIGVDKLFFYAKLQMVLLAVGLGIAVFAWANELFGFEAALAALFLYGLDPNILAHSEIVHTDLPFAAFSFTAIYFLWRSFRRITWRDISFFCLFFALAAATKHSFIALLPSLFALGAVGILSSRPLASAIGKTRALSDQRSKTLAMLAIFSAAALTAYIFLWTVYGFRFHAGPRGIAVAPTAMPTTPWIRDLMSLLLEFQIFPHAWIDGQIFNITHLTRTTYLLGEVSDVGFWAYFPVTFAVKTPLPTLALLVFGVYLIARRRIDAMAALFLLVPPVVYFFLAVVSRMNIGHRHILQVYPFLFVLAGAAAAKLWKTGRPGQAAVALLGFWLVGSAVFIYPNHLAYFNELAGGPKNGYRVVVDSNLDWGQDLKGLKTFLDEKGIGKIYLSYFGTADPCFYKINFAYIAALPPRPQPCAGAAADDKAPDFLAVSATNRFLTRTYYDWLASYRPIAQIGYSIFVYDFRGNREAHKNLGIVYLKSGELNEARREFTLAGEPLGDKQLAQIDLGDNSSVYVNLAAALLDKGMIDEATALFERALRLNPRDSDAHNNLGAAYLHKNRTDRAIEEFEAALKIQPANAEAHNNLGTAYLRKGRADLASTQYNEALRLKPDYKDARENLKLAEQARASQQPKR